MKKIKIIGTLIIIVALLMQFSQFSFAEITDEDNGKMKYYKPRSSYEGAYDIQGYVNGELQSTTFMDHGYFAKLKVDNNEEKELNISKAEREINGITWDIECSFINNGRYVKTTYSLTNTTDTPKTISLGVYVDVQIAGNDRATIERFENSKGLRLYDTETNIQFSFYGKSVAGTTNIDQLWIGTYPDHRENYFSNNDTQKIEKKDSAFTYSWMDRTLAPGVTNKYSTIIGMGEVSNAPSIKLDETQGNCFSQDNVVINGTISDADPNSKVTLHYMVDNGQEKELAEQALVNNKVDFALDLSSLNLSAGRHRVTLWALDESGNPSETVEKEIIITTIKAPTLNMSEEWTKDPVKFTITDTINDASEVQKYQYKIEDGQWKDVALETEVTALENTGTAVVTVRTVGKNENEYSSTVSKTARVDKEKPTVTVTGKDGKVKIAAADQHSGVKETKYVFTNKKELSGTEEYTTYTGEVGYKGNKDEVVYLHIICTDKVGNELIVTKEYKLPVAATIETEKSFTNKKPTYKLKDEANQPSDYIFQVKINDGEWKDANVNTEYAIDNPISGNNTIKTRTIDPLGRISEEKTATTYFSGTIDDTTNPGILPQTGVSSSIIIVIAVLSIVATITFFVCKKYKNIK